MPPRNVAVLDTATRDAGFRGQVADVCECMAASLLLWLLAIGALALLGLYLTGAVGSLSWWTALPVLPLCWWTWCGWRGRQAAVAVLLGSGLTLALVWLFIGYAAGQFDHSWDGVSYHQQAILHMLDGWAGFPGRLPDSVMYTDWIFNYCKLPWAISAGFAAATGSIESAMAVNLLLLIAAVLLLVAGFLRCSALPGWMAVLVGLAALNPVSIYQSMSFYIDGQLANLMLAQIGLGISLLASPRRRHLLLLAAILILSMNVKQTGIAFAGLLSLALLAALAWQQREWLRRTFLSAAAGGLLGGLLFGFSPYVTNSIEHGNPLYPLFGNEANFDIAQNQRPPGFEERSRLSRLAISSVSAPTLARLGEAELRLPFQFSAEERLRYRGADVRLGGWGVLFSASLLLATLALLALPWIPHTARRPGLILLAALAISVLINSEAWWARYNPQWIMLPWCMGVLLLFASQRWLRAGGVTLLALLLVNGILVASAYFPQQQQRSDFIRAALTQVKDSRQAIAVWFGPFPSNRQRLRNFGIDYVEVSSREQLPCHTPRRIFAHEGLYCPSSP